MQSHEQQEGLVGGRHTVCEFLSRAPEKVHSLLIDERKSGRGLQEVLSCSKAAGVRYQFVPRRKLDRFPLNNHQGYVLRLFAPGYIQTEALCRQACQADFPIILALDQVQDEGNLGTLARSLFALGGVGMVLPKNRTASLGAQAQQAAAGALSELPVARETNLSRFLRTAREDGFFTCYAGMGHGCRSVYDQEVAWPLILVLGNEEKGVRPGVAKACEAGVTIPLQRGFDSLNVAQAGAMLLMELYRRSRQPSR